MLEHCYCPECIFVETNFCGSFSNFARSSAFLDIRFSKLRAKRRTQVTSIFSGCKKRAVKLNPYHLEIPLFFHTHSCRLVLILLVEIFHSLRGFLGHSSTKKPAFFVVWQVFLEIRRELWTSLAFVFFIFVFDCRGFAFTLDIAVCAELRGFVKFG